MNSKEHLVYSIVKSLIRIFSCMACLINENILTLAFGFLIAELLGIMEELCDER